MRNIIIAAAGIVIYLMAATVVPTEESAPVQTCDVVDYYPSGKVTTVNTNGVYVHYFADPTTELCFALLRGRVPTKHGSSYGFGNVVQVPCGKALAAIHPQP